MKTPDIIIAHPGSEDKFEALKAFMKALKIKFEVPTKDKPYNPEFVAKILQGDQDIKAGKTTKIKLDDIWK